jgi:hypothetical protein
MRAHFLSITDEAVEHTHMKKEDRICCLMYKKSCALEKKPIGDAELFCRAYMHKTKTNTCWDCHDFKSTSDKPQGKLSIKQRQNVAHKCEGVCSGFTTCYFMLVCLCLSFFLFFFSKNSLFI